MANVLNLAVEDSAEVIDGLHADIFIVLSQCIPIFIRSFQCIPEWGIINHAFTYLFSDKY